MSTFKLTGYHSHRHPFLGESLDDYVPPSDDIVPTQVPPDVEAELAFGADEAEQPLAWSKLARPFVAGGVAGLVTYATCRSFDVDKKKARQVSVVLAGLNILVGLAQDFIFREMKALASEGGVPVKVVKT